jgi:hypothetical protein
MKKVIFVIAILMIPILAFAEQPLWVTADGESYQGEMDTPKEVRDRARRDAQTKAIDQAVGTFIKAHTLVSNSQIADDLVYAAVRGKIMKQTVITADWDAKERNLYRMKIKALVEPVYPEKGESLSARLSLSKKNLKAGEEVQIFYQVGKDAYVYIFSVAADGSVTLLLPNSGIRDNLARAGEPYQFPPPDSRIQLKAMFLPIYKESFAEEKIKIIATRQKEELLPLGFREGIFQTYDAKSTGMISDLVRRLNQIEPADWAEATAHYTIKR